MLQVKEIRAAEAYPIRREVLRKHIPLPYEFDGDSDKDTIHIGTYSENRLIAIASFMKSNHPKFDGSQYHLRGMATLKDYRGLGAGKLMLRKILVKFEKMGINFLWCNARIEAVDFYKKQGLQTIGEQFNVPHIGAHYIMFKKIG